MQPQKAKPPLIKCLPRSDFFGGMLFWCFYCRRWHYHGRGNGSRVAHCTFDSPLYATDYIIRMASKEELREIRKGIDRWLEG